MKKTLVLSIILAFSFIISNAQNTHRIPQNLAFLDAKPIHWGFTFGANISNFTIYKSQTFVNNTDSIQILGIENFSTPGMFLGPIVNFRLGRFIDFRILFDISLVQRKFSYYELLADSSLKTTEIQVPSYFIELPALVKLKGARINNFRPYLVTGAAFKYDLASMRKVDPNAPYLITNPVDFYLEIGPGFDFYLPYFKFSIELKYSGGLLNMLGPQNTIYSRSIASLKSNTFMISFHFED